MAMTREQVDGFHSFALERLADGGAESLEECLRAWRVQTEREETIAAIRRGERDVEAGRSHSADELDAEMRRRFAALP
ncbi:MAG: type II toxin-antitoxin system ParD family antitoxin [Planctomycetes bacterium]|nr:type II toxin-antitoxin system ParD family antitoxin [Planctomycetota bacterium]